MEKVPEKVIVRRPRHVAQLRDTLNVKRVAIAFQMNFSRARIDGGERGLGILPEDASFDAIRPKSAIVQNSNAQSVLSLVYRFP